MGFTTGLGLPTMLGRRYYYVQDGHEIDPKSGSGCDCSSIHAQNGSYSFNGTSSEIKQRTNYTIHDQCPQDHIGPVGASSDREFSIGVWIYLDDATSNTIVSKMGYANQTNRTFILYFDSADKLIFRIYDEATYNSGTGDNYIQIKTNSAQTALQGGWHFVAATYDGSAAHGGLELYIDGSSATATKSTNNGYTKATNTGAGVVWGTDFESSNYIITSPTNVGGWFDGLMYNMAIWNEELTAGTVTDLWNNGNSYTYSVGANSTWTGPSDLSFATHYTDQSTSGAVDECPDLQLYWPGGPAVPTVYGGVTYDIITDWSCDGCEGIEVNVSINSSHPGSYNTNITPYNRYGYTPNIVRTGITETIRIWLASGVDNLAVGLWPNSAVGDTGADATQGTSESQASLSNDGTSYGLDFDGSADFYEFLDGEGSNYDFAIAEDAGLTISWVMNRDVNGANHTLLSTGDTSHFLEVKTGGNELLIKLGGTSTTVTPIETGLFASGQKVLVTLTREADSTGNLHVYVNGKEKPQEAQAANPGSGEFDTLGTRNNNRYFNGKIYELVMYNSYLDDVDRTALHNYLLATHSIDD